MIAELPIYENVQPQEKGQTWDLSFQTYRYLARTALKIIHDLPNTMGIYRIPGSKVCLDLFSDNLMLTIRIHADEQEISLYKSHLDDGGGGKLVLIMENSEASWKKLGQVARKEFTI